MILGKHDWTNPSVLALLLEKSRLTQGEGRIPSPLMGEG